MGKGDIEAQTRQVLTNIQKVVESVGGTMTDIAKVTVFVTDVSHIDRIHEVRAPNQAQSLTPRTFFVSAKPPSAAKRDASPRRTASDASGTKEAWLCHHPMASSSESKLT